jgi:hypothetical protein
VFIIIDDHTFSSLHRRRQQWIEGNCKEQSRNMYCATDVGNDENNVDEDDETKEPVTDSPLMPSHSDDTRHNSQIEPDTDAYGSGWVQFNSLYNHRNH